MSDSTLFHVVVCAAIFNDKNQVFLARRKADKKLGGFWEFPGGKLENGETLENALQREIQEELKITISNIELLHIKPFTYDHGQVLILFYTCDWESGDIALQDHDKMAWCEVDELSDYKLLPANEEAIAKLKEKRQSLTAL